MRSSAKLFCGNNCPNLEADIEAIVQLESELAQARIGLEVSRDPKNAELKLSLKEFSTRTNFNWLNEVVIPVYKAFGLTTDLPTDSQGVIISDVGYFTKLVGILAKTSPRTVANLVGWRVITISGPQSSELFRQNSFTFNKVHLGLKKMPERAESCYFHVNGVLGYPQLSMAVSRLWIDHHFSPEEKLESEHLVESIQRTFGHLLLDNSWIADEKTRFAALKKLSSITRKVGYTNALLKNDYLDHMYSLNGNASLFEALLSEGNYLKSLRTVALNGLRLGFATLKGPSMLNEDLWLISPATINAVYFYKDNSISKYNFVF